MTYCPLVPVPETVNLPEFVSVGGTSSNVTRCTALDGRGKISLNFSVSRMACRALLSAFFGLRP